MVDESPEKLPPIKHLTALKPVEQADGTLFSPKLEQEVIDHVQHVARRSNEVWEETDELKTRGNARALAIYYMLATSMKLQTDGRDKELWATRYNQACEELFGVPEQDEFDSVFADYYRSVSREEPRAQTESLFELIGTPSAETNARDPEKEELHDAVRVVFEDMFGDVLDSLATSARTMYEPDDLANVFERGLNFLKNGDEAWSDWKLELVDGDSVSVFSEKQIIAIGRNRPATNGIAVQALFAHEVLGHANRATNAIRIEDERLQVGLQGYTDFEEGMGMYFEYLVTGKVPEKGANRYLYIGLALGMDRGGVKRTRQELLEIASRTHETKQQRDPDQNLEVDFVNTKADINRIYRGSRGNEFISVFSKDISYHEGFIAVRNYFETQVEAGIEPVRILRYLLSGKFDPNDDSHSEYVSKQHGIVL